MAKGKAKVVSAPSKPGTRRLKQRDCPDIEAVQAVNDEATLQGQDTEGNNTAGVIKASQCLQESANNPNQPHQPAELSCLSQRDDSTEEKHEEALVKVSEEQIENSVTYPNNDYLLQGPENDTNKNEMELVDSENREATIVGSDTCTEVPTSEDGEKEKHNSVCNIGKSHESSQEELIDMCIDDFKEIPHESEVGLPVRKKRRMGMCGLTEKERSHFLQTQKHENGLNEVERVDKQLYKESAEHVAQEVKIAQVLLLSSPFSTTEVGITENKSQSSLCGEEIRAETEDTILDGTIAFPEVKSNENDVSTLSGSKQMDELKSTQPAEDKVDGHLVNLNQQKYEESTGETPLKGHDSQVVSVCGPVHTSRTSSPQDEQTEKKKCGSEFSSPQVCVNLTSNKIIENTGAASTDPSSGGFSSGSDTVVTSSKAKDPCVSDVAPATGFSTMKTEDIQPGETPETLHCLDYVSDSQLNSIALIEEETMQREKAAGFSNCPKDASDLIVGLIRELSSLNRKVMATHRELENLRRGNKTSRSSKCGGGGH